MGRFLVPLTRGWAGGLGGECGGTGNREGQGRSILYSTNVSFADRVEVDLHP
jgi:hypothetical protein